MRHSSPVIVVPRFFLIFCPSIQSFGKKGLMKREKEDCVQPATRKSQQMGTEYKNVNNTLPPYVPSWSVSRRVEGKKNESKMRKTKACRERQRKKWPTEGRGVRRRKKKRNTGMAINERQILPKLIFYFRGKNALSVHLVFLFLVTIIIFFFLNRQPLSLQPDYLAFVACAEFRRRMNC